MDQEKFDLIFSGELVPGFELEQVKKNIQLLFRIDEAKTEVLFSGRAIGLKKGLDAETANKYRVAIKKAGARVAVVQSQGPAAAAQKAPVAKPAAAPTAGAKAPSQAESGAGFSTALGAQPDAPRQSRPEITAPSYEVAATGEDMLPTEYKLPLVEVEVDISALSVAPQEGRLVREDEIPRPQAVPVNVPDIDVAPVGSDVLAANERPKVEAKAVDTSSLSVAQAGERLAPPAKQAPPPPNVDHIKLKE